MVDCRRVGKYWKCRNSLTNGPIGTKLGWSRPITFPTCPRDAVVMATTVS